MSFLETLRKRAREENEKQRRQAIIQSQPVSPTPEFIQNLQKRIGPQAPAKVDIRARDVIAEMPRATGKVMRGIGRFGVGVLRDFPRSVAQLTLKATGQERFVPGTGIAPRVEKFLFGKEPIYTPEETGRQFLQAFGVGEEQAKRLGGVAGYPLAVLGAIPILGKKKKLATELAKAGTRSGTKVLLKQALKGVDEKALDDLAKRLTPIKDPKVIVRELDEFAKKWRPPEGIRAKEVKPGVKPAVPVRPVVKPILKELEPLAAEARKFDTAEEFVSTVRPTPVRGLRKEEIEDFIRSQRVNLSPSEIVGEVEVFRGSRRPEKELLPGDFVSIRRDIASFFGENITSKKVQGKDLLRTPNRELIYAPGGISNLVDFYHQAVREVKSEIPIRKPPIKPPVETPPIKPPIVEAPTRKIGLQFKERGLIRRVKETSPELKQMVHGQYVPRTTDRLAIKARNLIRDDIITAERMAREGTNDKAVAVASELANHYNNLGALAKNEVDKLKFYGRSADIIHDLAVRLTEAGRTVQAASIYGRLTPEGILRFSARQIQQYNEKIAKVPPLIRKIQGLPDKLPNMTAQQAQELTERARAIQAMPDGEAKSMAFHALQDDISKIVPTPAMKKIINIWKAGLLTGIRTTGLNVGANLFHGISEVVKDVPATVVDSVAALFTKKREVAFTAKGLRGGIREGFEKGVRYLRTGFDERDIGIKLDYKRVHYGNSPIARALQKYERSIFRFIGAQDQPFYYGAKARSLQSQAMAQAINKKLRGADAQKFIDDLVANPTDDMLKNAVSDAETAVFQNKTALGRAGQAIQRIGGGAGEVVIPFARTPAAVAMQVLNYSPVGIARAIGEAVLAGRNFPQIQRQFSLAMGRGITGTAVLGLGSHLFAQGRISLGFPTDERERKQWELEGKQPNSILIGGKWRRAHILGPAGLMLIWGGHMRRFYDETGSQTEAANMSEAFLRSLGGMGQTFTEQTFVQGLDSVLGLLTDPERNWQRSIRTLAGPLGPSAIPTIVANIAQAIDPYQRRTGPGLGGIFVEGAMARIPGLRQQLEPRIDVAGEIVPRQGSPLEAMIDPTRPVAERVLTPVVEELTRLSDAGYRATPTDFGGRHGFRSLTPEQNTILEQNAGQRLFRALETLFASEEYGAMTDEERELTIQRFMRTARRNARAELLKEVLYGPDGPQGEELTARIKELKEDKVLTQEVRERLLDLLEQEGRL